MAVLHVHPDSCISWKKADTHAPCRRGGESQTPVYSRPWKHTVTKQPLPSVTSLDHANSITSSVLSSEDHSLTCIYIYTYIHRSFLFYIYCGFICGHLCESVGFGSRRWCFLHRRNRSVLTIDHIGSNTPDISVNRHVMSLLFSSPFEFSFCFVLHEASMSNVVFKEKELGEHGAGG